MYNWVVFAASQLPLMLTDWHRPAVAPRRLLLHGDVGL